MKAVAVIPKNREIKLLEQEAPRASSPTEVQLRMVLKNHLVFGTVNAGRNAYETAIRDLGTFMERWPRTVRSLITGRFPIEEHRDLLLGKRRGIKNVITPM